MKKKTATKKAAAQKPVSKEAAMRAALTGALTAKPQSQAQIRAKSGLSDDRTYYDPLNALVRAGVAAKAKVEVDGKSRVGFKLSK